MNIKPLHIISMLCLLLIARQAISNQEQPLRIISLNSNVSEILMAYDMKDSVIASDVTSQTVFNDTRIKNLGYHRTLPAEGILSLQASLILGSSHMGPEETLNTLEKAKLNIIKFDDPTDTRALKQQIAEIGELLNNQHTAQSLNEHIDQQIQHIQQLTTKRSQTIIFLLDMGQAGISMSGRKTTGEALLNILNGDFVPSYEGYKPISTEAILAINPDVILIGQRDGNILSTEQLMQQLPVLAHTKAGKDNNIISINAAKMIAGVSLGLLDEAERIAQRLAAIGSN